jgi:predicted ester cyclase
MAMSPPSPRSCTPTSSTTTALPAHRRGWRAWPAWSLRMLQAAFSDRRWEIHQVIAEDDTVVLYCTFHGRHTGQFLGLAPTSRSVAFGQVHIIRFQDGMGIEHWAVPDDLDLARQLGPIPRPPSQPVLADALAQLLSDLHP